MANKVNFLIKIEFIRCFSQDVTQIVILFPIHTKLARLVKTLWRTQQRLSPGKSCDYIKKKSVFTR